MQALFLPLAALRNVAVRGAVRSGNMNSSDAVPMPVGDERQDQEYARDLSGPKD